METAVAGFEWQATIQTFWIFEREADTLTRAEFQLNLIFVP